MNKHTFTTAGLITAAAGGILILSGLYPRITGSSYQVELISGTVRSGLPEIILGTILLAAGGAAFLWFRQGPDDPAGEASVSRRDPLLEKPIPEGRITATVIGISRGLRMEGGETSYHVICRYDIPDTDRNVTFSSEPLKEYPGKDLIGKHVRVYLHSLGDEAYRVDLDSIL